MGENEKAVNKSGLNKTWVLVAGLVVLTVVLLAVSINSRSIPGLPSQTEETKQQAAYTTLTISEDLHTSTVSGSYETDVFIDTDKNEVTAVQLELSYEPNILTKVDVKPGNFLENPTVLIKNVDAKNGRITFALANTPGKEAVMGTGVIATLSFTKISSQATSINFLPHTAVAAPGYNQSVLKNAIPAVIEILTTPPVTRTFVSPIPTQ